MGICIGYGRKKDYKALFKDIDDIFVSLVMDLKGIRNDKIWILRTIDEYGVKEVSLNQFDDVIAELKSIEIKMDQATQDVVNEIIKIFQDAKANELSSIVFVGD